MKIKNTKQLCLIAFALVLAAGLFYQSSKPNELSYNSTNYRDGEFKNLEDIHEMGFSEMKTMISRYIFDTEIDNTPKSPIPVVPLTSPDINRLPEGKLSIVKMGHSTVLIKIANQLWLTDPVFSERASPFLWLGPKRFHSPPIDIASLPPLDGVLISHNHYDHLDQRSIEQLKHKAKTFLVPLGVSQYLLEWGVEKTKIHEMDWWSSHNIAGLNITATPAQHFSGRGLLDRNHTLWNSWSLKTSTQSVFFSGDSGYFDGFKTIRERIGTFDIALLEVGAYDTLWPDVHMHPEEALSAFNDLGASIFIPIHNSTFDLGFHPWYEPLDWLSRLFQGHNHALKTPKFGQIYTFPKPLKTHRWWHRKSRSSQ